MPAAEDPIPDTLGKIIAANVRAERARRNWTQTELAARLGWKQNVLSTLELERRTVLADDLLPLCRALGVPLTVLFRGLEAEDRNTLGLRTAPPS